MFSWDQIEPSRGRYQYGSLDDLVNSSGSAGLSLDAVLIGMPPWAKDPRTQLPSGLSRPWNDPQNLWAQFVKQTVTRYRSQVHYWEIWNEPDDPDVFWAGTVADYYQLLKVSYQAVKSVDPSAQVILAGMAYWTGPQFLPDLLQAMAADPNGRANRYYFDILALHSYGRTTGVLDRTEWAKAQLASTVGDRPIWMNETNVAAWNVSGYNHFLPYQWSSTTAEQASYIIQSFAYALAAGVAKVFVYRFHDVGETLNYAVVGRDGSTYPAYTAYQIAARYFSRATNATLARQGEVEQVVMRRPGERITVVWNRSGTRVAAHIGAQTLTATSIDRTGATRSLQAGGGQYQVDLPAATANKGLDGYDFFIGGEPMILVETLPTSQQSAGIPSALISYAGEWAFVPSGGSSSGTLRRTVTTGAGAAIGFEGPTVTWTTSKGPDRGVVRLAVDGSLQAEIDLYNPTVVLQAPFTFGPFSSGRHRLTITATGRKASAATDAAVDIDSVSAAALFATQPPPPPAPPAPSPTVTVESPIAVPVGVSSTSDPTQADPQSADAEGDPAPDSDIPLALPDGSDQTDID